jgi:hypothetical protein
MELIRRRCAIALGLLLFAGCSAAKGSLSGTVTYQDRPVVYGTVFAVCTDGITRSADIQPNGSYRLENLPIGEVKLAVLSPEPPKNAAHERRGDRSGRGKTAPIPTVDRSKWFKIPEKYSDPRLSSLATTISAGHSTFELQLQ